MPIATANGIDLAYGTFGRSDDPALLLVMGLGRGMDAWDDRLCSMVADRGYHVIRFDNRDIGRSTRFAGVVPADGASAPPYSLDDLADDTAALLDALGIERAHLVGASMGGMIAQLVTINHPHRVLSLCSIMSTPGSIGVEPASAVAAAIAELGTPPPNREDAIEREVRLSQVLAGPGYPPDEQRVRAWAGAAWDDDPVHDPGNIARQLAAIRSAPDRRVALGRLRVPTLVLHGTDDPLIDPEGGKATATSIPGAELVLIPGMGHDLPEPLWPELVDLIVANARK